MTACGQINIPVCGSQTSKNNECETNSFTSNDSTNNIVAIATSSPVQYLGYLVVPYQFGSSTPWTGSKFFFDKQSWDCLVGQYFSSMKSNDEILEKRTNIENNLSFDFEKFLYFAYQVEVPGGFGHVAVEKITEFARGRFQIDYFGIPALTVNQSSYQTLFFSINRSLIDPITHIKKSQPFVREISEFMDEESKEKCKCVNELFLESFRSGLFSLLGSNGSGEKISTHDISSEKTALINELTPIMRRIWAQYVGYNLAYSNKNSENPEKQLSKKIFIYSFISMYNEF